MKKIGFIGLGLMGRPMAERLLAAGHPMIVHNRSQGPVREMVSKGAGSGSSPREVAANVNVVITMVPDAPDVEKIALGDGGIIEGAHDSLIYIDMSTISPSTTRHVGRILAGKGVRMLDAPVSGGVLGAQNGTLSIMVGGDESAFRECLPIFNVLGKTIVHHGELGLGEVAKLCNQILVSLQMLSVCEAFTLASKCGLDLNKLLESVRGGAAASWTLSNLAPRILKGDLEPGFRASHQNKDLKHLINLAYELKVPLPGVSLVQQLFSALEAEGLGEKGTQALIAVYRKMANLTS